MSDTTKASLAKCLIGGLSAALLAMPSLSLAQEHICGFTSVVEHAGGISVKIAREGPSQFVITNEKGQTIYDNQGDVYQPLNNERQPVGPSVKIVDMKLGDDYFGWSNAHDSCTATVVVQDGKIGLLGSTPGMHNYSTGINEPDLTEFVTAEKPEPASK